MNTWTRALLVISPAPGVPGCQEPQPAQKPASCPASFLDAIQSGAADAIETHLSLGCDVNAKSGNVVKPLQAAEEQGWSAAASFLRQYTPGNEHKSPPRHSRHGG